MQEAYIIGNIFVKDETKWAEYKSNVSATILPWGGELVFRGKILKNYASAGENKHNHGKSNHTENVIIKFPNSQALENWYQSDAYQTLLPIRELGAEIDLNSYQSQD